MDTKSSVGALHNVHVGTSLLHHSLLHFSLLHIIGTMVMVVVCQYGIAKILSGVRGRFGKRPDFFSDIFSLGNFPFKLIADLVCIK